MRLIIEARLEEAQTGATAAEATRGMPWKSGSRTTTTLSIVMLRWRSQAAKSIRQTLRSAGRGPLPIERSLHLGNSSWLRHDSVFNVSDAFDFNSDDIPALQIDGRQPRGADPRWGTRRENI